MKKYLSIAVFFLLVSDVFYAQTNDRIINIDATKVKGDLNTFFNECVGAGRANEGLRADWQRQLRYSKQQLGF